MDDNIAQFTALTSADPHRAAQYLRLTENNLEQAISLYFESPNLDLGAPEADASTAAPQPAPAPAYEPKGSSHAEPIEIDSDEDRLEARAAEPHAAEASSHAQSSHGVDFEDDEALARRLQEEFYAGAEAGSPEGVRAPMARTTETLVGPGANWDNDDLDAAVAEQMLARQRRNVSRPGIFNQRAAAGSIWEDTNADPATRRRDLSRATAGASEMSSKSSLLAEMYRPPFEIICRLPWEDAREDGKKNEKWLLVNVQDPAIFDCQVLNRDIWKNPEIKETIKENFLFMQYQKDDPAGNKYIQYYFHARDSQDAYPHIAIVDPRTGEQVKVWSGRPVPKPMDFLMQLHEFLDRYSLNPNARNPVAQRKPERKAIDVDRMTEEEMLEMALQNSLANGGINGPRDEDPDELTRQPITQHASAKGKEKAEDVPMMDTDIPAETSEASKLANAFSTISANHPHQEPASDPSTTTRIQFKYSGGREIRRFALTDPVRRIYEWLKSTPLEGKEGLDFELTFMGTNLIDQLETSIQDAGLKNGTVMVEFSSE